MISYKVKDGVLEKLSVEGSLATIAAESIVLLKVIHKNISEDNKSAADDYRNLIEIAIKEGVVFDDEKLIEKTISKMDKSAIDRLWDALVDEVKECGEDD